MNEHEHDDLLKRLDSLNLDVPPLPEGFHAGWVGRLEEEPMETKPKKSAKVILTRALSAAAALVFIVGGTLLAQGHETKTEMGVAQSYARDTNDFGARLYGAVEDDMVEYETTAAAGAGSMTASMKEVPAERMLIRTASLTIGTQRYDASLSTLYSLCEEAGGWTASSSENTADSGLRTCYLTLRVPADALDGFLSGTGELGRVIRRSESAEDVTESYRDTQARLETQQALMTRLQALVTDAASLSDLLELEAQIADTQYQIDRLQSSLNNTDRRVNFSTVDVTLREENAAAGITDGEKSLGERLVSAIQAGGAAFLTLLENAAVFLAAALPFIAIVAAVWLAVSLIRKRLQKGGSPR